MSTKPTGAPAFPIDEIDGGKPQTFVVNGLTHTKQTHLGLTAREWFAGHALSGLLAYGRGPNVPWADHPPSLARNAYEIADAMLAESEK